MNPAHLRPDMWDRANRLLAGRALAEFAHELLVKPCRLPDGRYEVRTDGGAGHYRFAADRLALDHWQVDPASISRSGEQPVDAMDLVIGLRDSLGLTDQVLPTYLEEIGSTCASLAFKLSRPPVSAAGLATADFQAIESRMVEGHPCFVANSGRLGFDMADYPRYAPETGQPVRLLWLAVHRDHASFSCSAELDYHQLIRSELDDRTLRRFTRAADLDDYLLMPVHPWQWWNRLSVTFAGEVARRRLVYLGLSDDSYQPQQSIRTFFNLTSPSRHYVKTALSVLNMGFVRGLSAEYMAGTPAINDWLADLVDRDDVLKRSGFGLLRERAAVGYRHPQFHPATGKGSPYRKMLAALWRESPVPLLEPGERPMTMAALLHRDHDGRSVASALIELSRLDPVAWLRRYLDVYLLPLVHCFYAYQLVFMPHGENVILVLDQRGVPRRALHKDLAEEIGVMDPELPLPPAVERIRSVAPDELKPLSILVDVFDGFLRFLSANLHTDGTLDQDRFWSTVADCVRDYQASVPELADRFRRYDLFVPEFARSCLNRLQLRDNQRMVDLDDPDPAGGLQFAGTLPNPIA